MYTRRKANGCGRMNGAIEDYIPAIYSAWQWHRIGNYSGSCSACSGHPGDFNCGYLFPCFGDEPGVNIWGHHECVSQHAGSLPPLDRH